MRKFIILLGPILTMCAFQYQLVTVTAGAVIVHSEDDYEQIVRKEAPSSLLKYSHQIHILV